ncbi:MAG TPA: 3-dehydroquinate synthase [Phycisphaerae bacterium]|nr:3-dehydroquinate synthase [Phycisphaerae bacterium]
MADDAITTQTVRVDLPGRSYSVQIGASLLASLGTLLRPRTQAAKATIITDTTVGPLYMEKACEGLRQGSIEPRSITIPAGETSKSLAQLSAVYDQLAAHHHGRDEPVIALGGGVVGDLAGLAAATWVRGVPFVQCPTTLEADIDASIGGKSAINHPAGKNLIGAFHQPLLVCIDIDCLASLPPRDFTAGLAESVKHAVILDAELLDWHCHVAAKILSRDPATLCELIHRNCAIKAAIVVADEREMEGAGLGRAVLNFGHTIGHALEAQSGFDLRHGEAVALGMVAEMELAVRQCGFDDAVRHRVERLLTGLGLRVRLDRSPELTDLFARIGMDKKARGGTVRFVVPRSLGQAQWIEPVENEIRTAVERLTSAP